MSTTPSSSRHSTHEQGQRHGHDHHGQQQGHREHSQAKHETARVPAEPPNLFCRIQDAFRIFARKTSQILGTAWAFVIALSIIVTWALMGHAFNYSDTWQLIINTGTTIVTFLMVFLIQNTQNRDAKAVHLKLDELIRALKGARNNMVDLEKLSDDDLKKLEDQFTRLRQRAEKAEDRLEDLVENQPR